MTDTNAQKLLQKIIDDLEHNGIITNTLVKDLKELRPYAVERELPVVAKAIRLTYQHVEENETFTIPIPRDEEIYDEEADEFIETQESEDNYDSKKSLLYLMNLIVHEENPLNKQEIRQYNEAMKEYAELN